MKNKLIFLGFFTLLFVFLLPVQAEEGEPRFLQITPGFKSLRLSWLPSSLEEAENLVLIRKENSCPKKFSDGEEVYRGNGNSWEDEKVLADRSYCYGIFKQDLSGRIIPLGFSGPVSIQNLQEFLTNILTDNRIIFSSFVLVLLLFWINKKTVPRREKIRIDFR
jgi:hypothetical protein